jgi:hypothetical protein
MGFARPRHFRIRCGSRSHSAARHGAASGVWAVIGVSILHAGVTVHVSMFSFRPSVAAICEACWCWCLLW